MTKKYQLKNGMTVLLIESHKSPVVAVQMWVKTGSADEKKGVEGISHFIEHLVFKGSEKFGVGEIAGAVEGAGGVLNAYTTFDQTVFYVTVSKEFADTGLEVISEMMGRPSFDEDEINREREVVIEEIKRSMDNPRQRASRMLFSTVYNRHPYGIPVIGYDDNIRRISKEEILRYYHSRYVPQNMNLVIVGDFKSEEMKKKINSFFGTFKKFKLKEVKRNIEPAQKQQRIVIQKASFAENILYLSWPTPKVNHKDIPALSVLAQILGQSESSRLVHKIKNEQGLVNSIGASLFSPKDQGFFTVSASLKSEHLERALDAIGEALLEIKVHGPTQEELARAIRSLESERYYSMETVDGLAGLYGHFELLYNDYKYFDKILKATKMVKAQDVALVAKKYLLMAKINISYLTGEETETGNKIIQSWSKKIEKANKTKKIAVRKLQKTKVQTLKWDQPKTETNKPVVKVQFGNGTKVVAKQIKSSPVISMRIGFEGGLRYEPHHLFGINELTSRVWATGTQTRTEEQLNQEIDDLASGIGTFAGRNSLGLSMTSLVPNFEKTFTLLEEILLAPSFDEKIIEREKSLMIEYIRQREDKPAQLCSLALVSALFGDHPYARDPFGTSDHVRALSAKDIRNYLDLVISSNNMVISIVGDIELKKWKSRFERLSERIGNKKFKKIKLDWKLPEQNKIIYKKAAKEQSHIAIAYPGIAVKDKDRFTLEVLQSVLSGQGGRLFVELRDKESLAYTVSPMRMDGLEPGYFGAYIGCSPEKSNKAVQMMLKEFGRLQNELVGDAELDRAKRYLLGRHDIALQRTGHVADLMLFDELYGLPFNEYERFNEKLHAVTAKDIQSLANRIFKQKYVLSVVGRDGVQI